jgi:hypothetical protein
MTAITALPTELATMREVVETLAPIERAAGEPGEQQAAAWIVERLSAAGAHNARIEEEQFYGGYPQLHAKLSALGVAAAVAGLISRRLRGSAALQARSHRQVRLGYTGVVGVGPCGSHNLPV